MGAAVAVHRRTDTRPYKRWVHRHLFEETPEGTLSTGGVAYQAPGGAPVNRLFTAVELRKIFGCRQAKLLELYPNRQSPVPKS